MVKLAEKNIRIVIRIVFNMFKNLIGDMKDIKKKKNQYEFLEIKNYSKMKKGKTSHLLVLMEI